MQQQSKDQRGTGRTRMLKGGVIAFSARHATIPCVVRDISEGGARLQVSQSTNVPDTFELIVELDGLEATCEIAWRKVTEVGVRFLEPVKRGAPRRLQIVGHTGAAARPSLRRHPIAPQLEPVPKAPAVEPPRVERSATAQVLRPKHAAAPASVIPILIAEDDPDDRLLMQDAFAESHFTHPIAFVENGVELLQYVRAEPPYQHRHFPGLILLDLNMPKMDGRTALMHLKTDSQFRRIPVIVLTTSNAEEDIQRTYDLGVTAYVSKPGSHQGLLELVSSLNDFWTRFVQLPSA
ncbi:MAG: response regulator [Proteobacteria bacterium]|nr:response regulator [Pseudomonadota bacterium]